MSDNNINTVCCDSNDFDVYFMALVSRKINCMRCLESRTDTAVDAPTFLGSLSSYRTGVIATLKVIYKSRIFNGSTVNGNDSELVRSSSGRGYEPAANCKAVCGVESKRVNINNKGFISRSGVSSYDSICLAVKSAIFCVKVYGEFYFLFNGSAAKRASAAAISFNFGRSPVGGVVMTAICDETSNYVF